MPKTYQFARPQKVIGTPKIRCSILHVLVVHPFVDVDVVRGGVPAAEPAHHQAVGRGEGQQAVLGQRDAEGRPAVADAAADLAGGGEKLGLQGSPNRTFFYKSQQH